MRLHHVQLAIPSGGEDLCRRFYCDVLGWTELTKPEALAARGGLWLQAGEDELHLGVDADFHPARKAHPAFLLENVTELAERLGAAGFSVEFDDAIPGVRRFYTFDPVGNRLEFMEDVENS
jgi:catechol 2,3-dioxygenase-like lactoylglutathione lyase family enzyme